MSFILSIESSASTASLALYKNKKLIGFEQSSDQRSHSEFVLLALEKILKKSLTQIKNLNHILVTNGPGSFTGLRVAICLAKSLSYALNVPIWTTDTLKVIRWQSPHDKSCFICMNAHKNLFFLGKYDPQNFTSNLQVATAEIAIKTLDSIQNKEPACVLLGDGLEILFSYQGKNSMSSLEPIIPNAKSLAEIYFADSTNGEFMSWMDLTPRYLRESDAELYITKV